MSQLPPIAESQSSSPPSAESSPDPRVSSLFTAPGEMSARMRTFDWANTPLGPPETWSSTLRSTVRLILANSFPMLLWWGPDFIQLYNDAYIPVLGDKHPHAALARPFRSCWSEVFHIVGPLAQRPFEGGPPTLIDDIQLEVNRFGFVEETHFTIGYSAVPDPAAPNGIGGVLATVQEITEKVLGDRRVLALRDLSTRSFEAKTVHEACQIATSTLASHRNDIPFALIYLVEENGSVARCVCGTGTEGSSRLSPELVRLSDPAQGSWPFMECRQQDAIVVTSDLESRFGPIPSGPWSDPPRAAATLPIHSNIAGQPHGFLVAGLSPRLQFNDSYRGFLELVSTQIANGIQNARAFDEERKRVEALAELDRAKTTFFSNVSHEFRTPLTLLMGPLEDALQQHGDPLTITRGNLELVHRNGLRLLKLVNTLLDFSRIEAGRIQAVYEPVALPAFTAELASIFRSAIEAAGLSFTIDCPPIGRPVYVDPEMWEKIVLNLLSNAFKFTLSGSIAVSVRRNQQNVELIVQDSGIGIAPADLPHIFERFYRVKNPNGRSYEGSGIGLAMVQELVKLNGGTIQVTSEVGRGTTFTVSIPMGTAHLPQDRIGNERTSSSTAIKAEAFLEEARRWLPARTPHVDSPARSSSNTGARPRIVLADDNADMREYIERLLHGSYRVESVADGEAALQAILRDPPDLVITDVMMPKIDGIALLKKLRSNERTSSTPVIVLSARAGEEFRVEGVEAGADDYLTKPFSARELLARVENHLVLARLRTETERRIRASEARLRALVSATSYAAFRMSPDWKEMRQLRGSGFLAETDTPKTTWLQEYILPEDQPLVLRAIQDAIQNKSVFELEHRVRRFDGSIGWTLSKAIPLLDEHGEIEEWFGAASDVTDRRSNQETQSRLAAIVDSADDAIISKDVNGIIRSWNEAATRMFGYTPSETIGHPIQMLIPENRHLEEDDILRKLRAGGRIEHYETLRLRKDGTPVEVSITISPIYDAAGNVTGASKIARDISDRKRLEQLLIQNEKLGATGRMAASIAHEINNPLESLVNLIYLARQDCGPDSRARDLLVTAEEELERVSHIARQTLGFYRDTSAPSGLFLHEVIQNVLTVYNAKLLAVGISADLRFGDSEKITASKGELLQVFSNIIANAIDSMPHGGSLCISTRKMTSTLGEGIEVVVRDTGTGIARENLDRIFEPFFTTKGDRGTGIGLWVAKQLIASRGGSITAASPPAGAQSGTSITVFLPSALPARLAERTQ